MFHSKNLHFFLKQYTVKAQTTGYDAHGIASIAIWLAWIHALKYVAMASMNREADCVSSYRIVWQALDIIEDLTSVPDLQESLRGSLGMG